jgi:hypothetical protein
MSLDMKEWSILSWCRGRFCFQADSSVYLVESLLLKLLDLGGVCRVVKEQVGGGGSAADEPLGVGAVGGSGRLIFAMSFGVGLRCAVRSPDGDGAHGSDEDDEHADGDD